MKRILAIGGGGFTTEAEPSPIDAYIRNLAGKPRPKGCFISAPSGDNTGQAEKFQRAYTALGCQPSNLPFFNGWGADVLPYSDYRERLLQQDVIFIGGGHLRSALAVCREWKLDVALKEAWECGTLLAGMSAGAMCWFEIGFGGPFEQGNYGAERSLGFIPGGCAAHYSNPHIPERRLNLLAEHRQGNLPRTLAIDDVAAALFEDDQIHEVLSWASGATAHQVEFDDGIVRGVTMTASQI
jgi:peptidase E